MSAPFAPSAFIKAKLLREPIYREDLNLWATLRAQHEEIRCYFREIGQELVLDEGEGFAFIRQIELQGDDPVPRLVQRRPLSYHATLLLVCLREELLRFDAAAGDSTRLVKSRSELQSLVAAFVPESNNEVRDVRALDNAIARLEDCGMLRALTGERQAFEVMRIVKARLAPADLEDIRERLKRHVKPND